MSPISYVEHTEAPRSPDRSTHSCSSRPTVLNQVGKTYSIKDFVTALPRLFAAQQSLTQVVAAVCLTRLTCHLPAHPCCPRPTRLLILNEAVETKLAPPSDSRAALSFSSRLLAQRALLSGTGRGIHGISNSYCISRLFKSFQPREHGTFPKTQHLARACTHAPAPVRRWSASSACFAFRSPPQRMRR